MQIQRLKKGVWNEKFTKSSYLTAKKDKVIQKYIVLSLYFLLDIFFKSLGFFEKKFFIFKYFSDFTKIFPHLSVQNSVKSA